MSNSSPHPTCPHCGSALLAGVPETQCPRCLMAQIIEPTQAGEAAAPIPSLTPEELAPHFPQLEILECLGRGGMGVVYKARQKSLNRLVALKLLAPERADDPQFAARFEKEAHALAALNHPNIVGVHDFGQAGGYYFLLMEFVDGMNLRQLLETKRLTPKEALSIVPPVCEALQCAHDHGIVHRDIKPENLLMDKSGTVKIADFGIAKMVTAQSDPTDASIQNATQAKGTPAYSAPEQQNGSADHRSDIYSLGVVLYEMLTGERPQQNFVPPSKRVQVDIRIDEIVVRALEKTPELRYQTAVEFRTQVQAAVATPLTSQSAGGIKATQAFVFPPTQFATASGWFYAFQWRGQLILDEQRLVYSHKGLDTIIPLASIRDLSMGQYPRSVSPFKSDLISLTYADGGELKQVLISPFEGWIGLPSDRNAFTAEWFQAIHRAVLVATGKAPGFTMPAGLGISAGSRRHVAMVFLPLVVTALLVTVLLSRPDGIWNDAVVTIAILTMLGLVALAFFWMIRIRRRAENPPELRHISGMHQAYSLGVIGVLCIIMAGVAFFGPAEYIGKAKEMFMWLVIMAVIQFVVWVVGRRGRTALIAVAQPEPPPPPPSRWQGWDVWVIGICLVTFGALWLERLSVARLQQSIERGFEASDFVLMSSLATVVLLSGAVFLWQLAKNLKSGSGSRSASFKRMLGRSLVPAVAVALLLRTFLLQPFWAVTDAAAPEIPRGSSVLVWKLTRTFAVSDLIAYIDQGRVNLGRIKEIGSDTVVVSRNGEPPTPMPRTTIIGKVVSVFWRASPQPEQPETSTTKHPPDVP